jgi:peptide/nickel transport system substrate-binding protein
MREDELDRIDEEAARRGISREDLIKRAAVGALALAGSGGVAQVARAAAGVDAAKPKRGGTFRVGVAGGSSSDIIDGQDIVTNPDQARLLAGWETLLNYDKNFKLQMNGLAENISAEKGNAAVWTINLRKGIEFHNGKTLTADDVAYSLKRLINPKLKLFGGAALGTLTPSGIKKMDKWTVRLHLKSKDVTILDSLAQYVAGIVPVGYSPNKVGGATLKQQVGTGPYKLKSFTPGQQSVHVRNPNYWRHGQPYFDQVVVIDFPDDTARVNALLGGQVDAAVQVPPAQVGVVNGHSGTKILESPTAQWTPLCMRVDTAPFTDVRVRQAMRLIANRPQIVAQALAGHGFVGNDLYAPFDAMYDHALPQRHQDIAQAKSLLKAAGQENLTVDLQSTNGALGMNEGAQVFAQQAAAAGVTVNVKILDSGTFYGSQYLKWPFSTDFWGTRNYLQQVAAGSLPTSPYNETHWPDGADGKFKSLYKQAIQTVDTAKRAEIEHEMMTIEYNHGGYLIWGFSNFLDGYSTKVQGLIQGDKGVIPLNGFASGFRTIWFA